MDCSQLRRASGLCGLLPARRSQLLNWHAFGEVLPNRPSQFRADLPMGDTLASENLLGDALLVCGDLSVRMRDACSASETPASG